METTQISPEPANKWIWPGLLIALPASVIVACAITAVFVVRHPDGLVASDYYKQGKAINAQLAKSDRAKELGFDSLEFVQSPDSLIARFPRAAAPLPIVEFVFAHPVDEAKDLRLVVRPEANGDYRIALPSRFGERRHVIVTDVPGKRWRFETSLARE